MSTIDSMCAGAAVRKNKGPLDAGLCFVGEPVRGVLNGRCVISGRNAIFANRGGVGLVAGGGWLPGFVLICWMHLT